MDASNHMNIRSALRLFTAAALLLCGVVALPANAQVFGTSATISLATSERFPKPLTTTTVSLNDYSVDTLGAQISWYVNGTERVENVNSRSIQITTGAIGTKTNIQALVTKTGEAPQKASLILIPRVVDVVIEPQTYVPYFYKGKALPSKDALVRAVAVVHDNTSTPDTTYTYRWTLNDSVLFGGAVRGKNVVEFAMPHFGDAELIVAVYDASGSQVGERAFTITARDPEIHFYEYSSLRGLLEREVVSPLTLTTKETTLYSEPYYLNATLENNTATYSWKINGTSVAGNPEKQNAITLEYTGGGKSSLDAHITTNTPVPQSVQKTLQLIFGN